MVKGNVHCQSERASLAQIPASSEAQLQSIHLTVICFMIIPAEVQQAVQNKLCYSSSNARLLRGPVFSCSIGNRYVAQGLVRGIRNRIQQLEMKDIGTWSSPRKRLLSSRIRLFGYKKLFVTLC